MDTVTSCPTCRGNFVMLSPKREKQTFFGYCPPVSRTNICDFQGLPALDVPCWRGRIWSTRPGTFSSFISMWLKCVYSFALISPLRFHSSSVQKLV